MRDQIARIEDVDAVAVLYAIRGYRVDPPNSIYILAIDAAAQRAAPEFHITPARPLAREIPAHRSDARRSAPESVIVTCMPCAVGVLLSALSITTGLLHALIGAGIARTLFDGRLQAIFNAVFTLSISPGLIALGMGWALQLALLGGLAPAVRSARLPVAQALRQA